MLTLAQLSKLWGDPISAGSVNLNDQLGRVCTDSRKLIKGDFFVPLKGKSFDGHSFLDKVYEMEAQATLVDRESSFLVPRELTHWLVDDTLIAYQQLALLNRLELRFPVVAVTGSVGKTTTREMIRATISSLGEILSTRENNNNDIGVPSTLLEGSISHVAAVIEMGMRSRGEIARLSDCTKPDIAVITNVGTAHIGRLGSREEIAEAKCEITSSLKSNGVVIIPAFNTLLDDVLKKRWHGRVVRVCLEETLCNYSNKNKSFLQSNNNSLLTARLNLEKGFLEVEGHLLRIPLEGRHNALNFLLAVAVARELRVPMESFDNLTVSTPKGRNNRIKVGEINILDETYNSSPEAVKAALELLISKPGRHFAALGTMHELGEHSLSLHKEIAEYVVKSSLDGLVIISQGIEAEEMYSVAKVLPKIIVVSSPEDAVIPLKEWLQPGDNLLVKGSRSVSMERLVKLF